MVPDSDAGALALLQSRRLFEGEVAATAAVNATPDTIAELALALRDLGAALGDDAEAPFRDFHVQVAHLCANNVTSACIANLWSTHRHDAYLHGRLDAAARFNRGAWVAGHTAIFAAIAGRDPHAARAAMNAFSDLAIVHLRQGIKMAPPSFTWLHPRDVDALQTSQGPARARPQFKAG